jgi:hypothetical protein
MTLEEHQRSIEEFKRRLPDAQEKALRKAAILMVATSRRKHLSGPRMPRGVSGGFDGSTLASKTGMIMRIHYLLKRTGSEVTGQVGMNLTNRGYNYPAAHEYGKGRMPERPWLRPAVAAHQKELYELIVAEAMKNLGSKYS